MRLVMFNVLVLVMVLGLMCGLSYGQSAPTVCANGVCLVQSGGVTASPMPPVRRFAPQPSPSPTEFSGWVLRRQCMPVRRLLGWRARWVMVPVYRQVQTANPVTQ